MSFNPMQLAAIMAQAMGQPNPLTGAMATPPTTPGATPYPTPQGATPANPAIAALMNAGYDPAQQLALGQSMGEQPEPNVPPTPMTPQTEGPRSVNPQFSEALLQRLLQSTMAGQNQMKSLGSLLGGR